MSDIRCRWYVRGQKVDIICTLSVLRIELGNKHWHKFKSEAGGWCVWNYRTNLNQVSAISACILPHYIKCHKQKWGHKMFSKMAIPCLNWHHIHISVSPIPFQWIEDVQQRIAATVHCFGLCSLFEVNWRTLFGLDRGVLCLAFDRVVLCQGPFGCLAEYYSV